MRATVTWLCHFAGNPFMRHRQPCIDPRPQTPGPGPVESIGRCMSGIRGHGIVRYAVVLVRGLRPSTGALLPLQQGEADFQLFEARRQGLSGGLLCSPQAVLPVVFWVSASIAFPAGSRWRGSGRTVRSVAQRSALWSSSRCSATSCSGVGAGTAERGYLSFTPPSRSGSDSFFS